MVGVTGFEPAASTSQTSRASSCATPRKVKNIEFLRFFRKWSNLWSNRFLVRFFENNECRKSQCFQGLSAFLRFPESEIGGKLPKQARYQLRYIPIIEFYCFSFIQRATLASLLKHSLILQFDKLIVPCSLFLRFCLLTKCATDILTYNLLTFTSVIFSCFSIIAKFL